MKTSSKIYADLQATLAKIRALNAEVGTLQPISWNDRRLTFNEQQENQRRRDRSDQISIEIRNANTSASDLRKRYSEAMAAEQRPQVGGPSAALQALYAQRDRLASRLENLRDVRSQHALSSAEGDKKAKITLTKAVDDHAACEIELANINLAIGQAESRNAEVKREVDERTADSSFAAAQSAAENVIAHDHSTDMMMTALAEHLAQRPALLRAIRKTACDLDDSRMNVLSTVEVLHRAAKAAGLAPLLNISVRDAVPLEEASMTLLKLAIRRPAPKSAAA